MKLKASVNYKEIGKRIKRARENADISQEELGKLIGGLSPTAISLYEQGERKISLEVLSAIARVLKITVEELVEGYTEEVPSINYALRADKDLRKSKELQEQIMDYIEFLKEKRLKKHGKG